MITLVKIPGKVAVESDLSGVEAIYNKVAPNDYPEFVTFDEKYRIGMYVSDSGRLSLSGKNFVFNNRIVYGTVVFVGLDKEGSPVSLKKVQRAVIQDYLDHKSLR